MSAKNIKPKGLTVILTTGLLLGLFLSLYHLGCAGQESGPFPYPDGVYKGESDLYD